MIIYIDSENKCHATLSDGLREFETDMITEFFNGKCTAFIEGHIYVPEGETWARADGEVFDGEMISPWKNALTLERIQAEYDRELLLQTQADLADADAALAILGVTVDE